MNRDILLSLGVHLLVVFFAFTSSPFRAKSIINYGEVITVTLPSASQLADIMAQSAGQPEEIEVPPVPVEIPKPVEEIEPDIPISDPITKPAAEIEKPSPGPEEKEPEKEKSVQKLPDSETAETGDEDQSGDAEGKVDVEATAAGGTVLSGASVDNASFNYPYWFTQAFYKISGNLRNPVNYDGTLVCVVYFQVIQSGRAFDIKIVEPSGIEAFDQACLAAIERSTPFPPLPREFNSEVIGITLPFKSY